ncbi:OmpW/AlkL family protein [Luteimonas aquatica]|uniref:OmpW/AlkL family protein n=1 Tax=Luteimonas aquatica TaxID=450364 RepID=UPI001F569426|nr:OmpW family outer membrane protein [Luteimonas aquatica]
MSSIRTLALAIATAAIGSAIAAPAFAQDASGDTASGKRYTIVGGYAHFEPTRNPVVADTLTKVNGGGAPTLSFSYNFNDNWSIEAWGADKVGHKVEVNGGKTASFDGQPYSLSGQYHFGAADNVFRPFVGLGYYEANYTNESTEGTGVAAGQRLGIETVKGAVATAGVDLNINPTWFARADLRYFEGNSDIKLNGAKAGEAKFNPVMIGVGLGARF